MLRFEKHDDRVSAGTEVVKRLSADQPPDMTGVRAEVHTTQIANFEGKREEEREIEKAL